MHAEHGWLAAHWLNGDNKAWATLGGSDGGSKGAWCRRMMQVGHAKAMAQLCLNPADQLDGQQGMATKVVETVVRADLRQPQHPGHQGGYALDGGVSGRG